eukprot:4271734-Lingulodinium_polyedra.AAC.1
MHQELIESSTSRGPQEVRDGEGLREEVRQRTITVAMGDGFQAMQLTEVHKVTDSMNALQSMAEQQQLRASVDELSK